MYWHFLDIPAIRERFAIELQDLAQIRDWVKNAGRAFRVGEKMPTAKPIIIHGRRV